MLYFSSLSLAWKNIHKVVIVSLFSLDNGHIHPPTPHRNTYPNSKVVEIRWVINIWPIPIYWADINVKNILISAITDVHVNIMSIFYLPQCLWTHLRLGNKDFIDLSNYSIHFFYISRMSSKKMIKNDQFTALFPNVKVMSAPPRPSISFYSAYLFGLWIQVNSKNRSLKQYLNNVICDF